MRTLSVALVLAVGTLWGCSSDSGSGSGPGSSLTTPAEVCDGTVGLMVGYFDQKCTAADKQSPDFAFIGAFLPLLTASCTSTLDKSVSSGRASIDYQKASECSSAMQQAMQSGFKAGAGLPGAAACDAFVVGKQAAGAPCAQPYECAGEATCVGFTDQQLGTCKVPAVGEDCGQGQGSASTLDFGADKAECAAGAFCDFGQCQPVKSDGGSCSDKEECKSGLRCYLDKCSSTAAAAGSQCVVENDCPEDHYCGNDVCTAKKSSGGSCKDSDECLGRCEAGKCVSFCGIG